MNTNFYHPDSLATAWHRVVTGRLSPHVAIGNFLDDWHRESEDSGRMALIRDPIPDSPDRDLHRWGAFVATLIEYLSVKAHMTPPTWVFAETWI